MGNKLKCFIQDMFLTSNKGFVLLFVLALFLMTFLRAFVAEGVIQKMPKGS